MEMKDGDFIVDAGDNIQGSVATSLTDGQCMVDIMNASKDCTGASVMIHHCDNLAGALKLKEAILKELAVKSVEIISCRGLNSFYAMEKGLIVGY